MKEYFKNLINKKKKYFKIIENASDYSINEKVFLKQWINGKEFYKRIREKYRTLQTESILENMFLTYDSRYKKTNYLYHGISFYKYNSFELIIYIKIRTSIYISYDKNIPQKIDYAPSSFSLNKETANWFSKAIDNDFKSIIYYLKPRFSNELDACSSELALQSSYRGEKELILATDKKNFQVLKISEKEDIMKVYIKEIRDDETN